MGKLIDGFATEGGEVITLKDGVYTSKFFNGNYEEAVKGIEETFDEDCQKHYIQLLEDCKNMNWLTDDLHECLKDDPKWEVREVIAKYSDRYHEELKDDEEWLVREAVAQFSDKYHEQFKDDKDWHVREAVARYSDKYHHLLKDDPDWGVREAVAECSDKYHEQLKDDEAWQVRAAVARYSDRYHEQLKDDEDYSVRLAVAKYSDKYHEYLKDDEHKLIRAVVARYSDKHQIVHEAIANYVPTNTDDAEDMTVTDMLRVVLEKKVQKLSERFRRPVTLKDYGLMYYAVQLCVGGISFVGQGDVDGDTTYAYRPEELDSLTRDILVTEDQLAMILHRGCEGAFVVTLQTVMEAVQDVKDFVEDVAE